MNAHNFHQTQLTGQKNLINAKLWSVQFVRTVFVSCATACAVASMSSGLKLETSGRSPDSVDALLDAKARDFALRMSRFDSGYIKSLAQSGRIRNKMSFPVRITLTENGRALPFNGRGGGDIQPVFDSSGARAFDASYRSYLQRVFTSAKPFIDTVFGAPAVGGAVRVRNYDADIQDRYAVGGGYYVPNGANGPEIRFPVYNNRVTAGINYVHTLLLAYLANKDYPWDAYTEGLVRAATILVCRTPGALPDSPDSDQIEGTLRATYDVNEFYDWFNNVGISGPQFIAPNLLNSQLPIGGSTGGVFLLRYQMAGSAWFKVAARYPGFIAEMNRRYFLSPNQFQTTTALEGLAQTAMDTVTGVQNSTIEGLTFRDWALRQHILDTRLNAGLKVLTTPIPIVAEAGTDDFGVFDVVLNAFQTKSNGDEILLSGSCFPIFWRPDFTRFFATAQDDVVRIAGAYGSVAPNFVGSTFAGKPYRVTVDLPFSGKNARAFLPAGAYSTGSDPDPKTFYGTITGIESNAYRVNVTWVGGSKTGIPVTNFAFGSLITDPNYLKPGPVTVTVTSGSTTVLRRDVVKSFGGLGVSLVPNNAYVTYSFTRPNRLDMVGLPLEPFRPNPADILGLSDAQTLFSRYNSNFGRYDLYPDEGEWRGGLGYWVRPPSTSSRSVKGMAIPKTPVSVSLSPGWNQVSVPFNTSTPTTRVLVTVKSESVGTFAQAVADGTLGQRFFEFSPDSANADLGTMLPATRFEPGKSYFVRVNNPDGAVLVFVPPGGPNNPGDRHNRTPQYQIAWTSQVDVTDPRSRTVSAKFGTAYNATRGFDLALDSDLPPLTNGFQASFANGRRYDCDIRDPYSTHTFDLVLRGLVPGRVYSLRLRPLVARQWLWMTDRTTSRYVYGETDYRFTADSTTMTMRFKP